MQKRRDTLTAWLFLAPVLLLFFTFIAYPIVFSGALSLTEWNFVSGLSGIEFVGLDNFQKMFHDETFLYALKNTLIYTVTIVPVSVVLSLILAYLLNDKVYLRKTLRLLFFIPYISNTVALVTVFKFMFRSDGPVNLFLSKLGMTELPQWFSNPNLTKVPIIILVIWTSIGYQVLIYMAALQDVPTSLYEAAEIDGTTPWQKFRKITVPLISPTTFYLIVIRTIAVFKLFTAVKIMTSGTTDRSSTTIVMEVYRHGFSNYDFGYASAMSWILFLIILTITLIQLWVQKKWVQY